MATEKKWTIDQTLDGYLMCWEIMTQCAAKFDLFISDGNKDYVKVSKVSTDSKLTILSQGHATKGSGNLIIKIKYNDDSVDIKSIQTSSIIASEYGTKGYIYSIAVEDSDDHDYNDVYMHITFWKSED